MTKNPNISSIPRKLLLNHYSDTTTLSIQQPPITKKIKNIDSKNPRKNEFVSIGIPKASLHILQDENSQQFIKMLDNHFHDLQCSTKDRYTKEIHLLTEEAMKEISKNSDDAFQHLERELDYARSDCTFILNQEEILRKTQQRLNTCIETYIKEAKQIQTEIQTLLLSTEPFGDDMWTDANKLLEEANILTNQYLQKMKDSMHKCNEADRKNKRKLMSQLF
ncbi:hypothetical protein PCK2_000906 [Pneumocystis canis]|nr:hypothetical protein PCK2_000906 [Pneumocystis canis]